MKNIPFPYYFIPPIIISTAVFGMIYVTAQQILRQGANDPQVQIVRDVATILEKGHQPSELDSPNKTDMAQSLSTYIIIYDKEHKPIASTGQLNGITPTPPVGVLEYAKAKGENRVTWQPRSDVRIALVVVPYADGFIAAGRSLKEVEVRENKLLIMVAIGWAITLFLGLTMVSIFMKCTRRQK